MIVIDADFNARNKHGMVMARVKDEILRELTIGQKVYLYDPVDVLYAEAVVDSFSNHSRRVSFDVDWHSFVDGVPASMDSGAGDAMVTRASFSSFAENLGELTETGSFAVIIQTGDMRFVVSDISRRHSASSFSGVKLRRLLSGLLHIEGRKPAVPLADDDDEQNLSAMPDVNNYVKQAI